jgi:hypothetical protein
VQQLFIDGECRLVQEVHEPGARRPSLVEGLGQRMGVSGGAVNSADLHAVVGGIPR